jgi:hypothetical protein
MRRIPLYIILIIAVVLSWHMRLEPQQDRKIELTAQAILARVDRIFEYPRGLIKGKIKHVKPDGSEYSVKITGYISREDFLFKFSSIDRGTQLKVLYNLGGEDIWVYNVHSLKLFHKLGIDKYDNILATNISFIDMSNADFQSNYTASIDGEAIVKGKESYKLTLRPIFKGGEYGLITMYVTKDELIPLRIDYHDRDKVIFKFLRVVQVMQKQNRVVPTRYEMMNIRKGTVTIVSFIDFEMGATFNKEIFRSEKLGE